VRSKRIKLARKVIKSGNFDCPLCVEPMVLSECNIDHIIPRSKGGGDAMQNLQLTHVICNSRRGAAMLFDYKDGDITGKMLQRMDARGRVKSKVIPSGAAKAYHKIMMKQDRDNLPEKRDRNQEIRFAAAMRRQMSKYKVGQLNRHPQEALTLRRM